MNSKKIFSFLFIQFFILGMGGSVIGPLIPVLANDFGVDLEIIGFALSMNAFGILLASLFSGIISERIGKKNIFISGTILFIISFLGLYFSRDFIYFILNYSVFGLSWGVIVVNSFSILSDEGEFDGGRSIMRLRIGMTLGALFSPLMVSGILFLNLNWRYLFIFIAFINLILLIIAFFYKN